MKKMPDRQNPGAAGARPGNANDQANHQANHQAKDSDNAENGSVSSAIPMLPGTEEPRSLGELMREAEALQKSQIIQEPHPEPVVEKSSDATPAVSGKSARVGRSKRPSRSQARRFARERALQALYQWEVSAGQGSTIRQEFLDTQDMSRVDVDFFITLFNGVSHHPQVLDDALHGCLDRPINELDPVERSVLRIATFELLKLPDIPARVVINEGIEITKRFGADKGHRYVNGVLDKLATSLRSLEMQRK